MPGGRPSEYDPKYCEMLQGHMKAGLSFEAFGGVIDVCKSTLYVWLDKHPEFMDSKKRAESKCRLFWEKMGIEGLWSTNDKGEMYSTSRSFNTGVWVFNMKNRFKDEWRERHDVELKHENVEKEKIKNMSTLELMELIKDNMKGDK